MTHIIDTQYKMIKHYIYKKKVEKSKFSKKEFQKARGSANPKKVQESFNKIAICLNTTKIEDIPIKDLDNVCFAICNTYKKNNNTLGVGPLKDGYLISELCHKKEYKIFYFYDPSRDDFLKYLSIFIKNTKKNLMIYYSGRCTTIYKHHKDDTAIVFDEGYVNGEELNTVLSNNWNKRSKIVLICDCFTGGSIWNLSFDKKQFPSFPSNVVSMYPVYNSTVPDMVKKAQKMHGIFTYYLCKFINETIDFSPTTLTSEMDPSLERFNISVMVESTNPYLESQSIFN